MLYTNRSLSLLNGLKKEIYSNFVLPEIIPLNGLKRFIVDVIPTTLHLLIETLKNSYK